MTPPPSEHAESCPSVDDLTALLDPLAQESGPLVDHLESCVTCRDTLEWLAGGDGTWGELQKSLSDTQYEDHRHRPTLHLVRSICALSADAPPEQDPLCSHEIAQLTELLEPASHPELLGKLGRYELEQLIGRGGMGLVFRAYDSELHRIVAVKTLAIHLVPLGTARARFIREGRACASLIHPHVVPIHDVVTEGAVPALVMQLVAGPTLEEWIAKQGPLPWRAAAELIIQLLDGLSLAHAKGFVHRDIKPGNVLLEAEGSRALLTDFGLVRTLDDATLTRSGMLAGTPDFMSPEQARGKQVAATSDLFSLGSLFYTMLTGHPPFRAADPMAILNRICHEEHRPLAETQEDIPREISQFVDRLLSKSPSERWPSAEAAKTHLEAILRGEVALVSRQNWLRESWRPWLVPLSILALIAWGMWMSANHSIPEKQQPRPLATQPSLPGTADDQVAGESSRHEFDLAKSGIPPKPQFALEFVELERLSRELKQLETDLNDLQQRTFSATEAPPSQPWLPDSSARQLRESLQQLESQMRFQDY